MPTRSLQRRHHPLSAASTSIIESSERLTASLQQLQSATIAANSNAVESRIDRSVEGPPSPRFTIDHLANRISRLLTCCDDFLEATWLSNTQLGTWNELATSRTMPAINLACDALVLESDVADYLSSRNVDDTTPRTSQGALDMGSLPEANSGSDGRSWR